MLQGHGLSERFACQVTRQSRSSQRRTPKNQTPQDPDRWRTRHWTTSSRSGGEILGREVNFVGYPEPAARDHRIQTDRWTMSDYYQKTITTELNCDGIFNLVNDTMPELASRRGESEAQGALIVSGRNGLGALIKFWLEEDEPGRAEVEIDLEDAQPDEAGSDAWSQELLTTRNPNIPSNRNRHTRTRRNRPTPPLKDRLPPKQQH